MASPPQVLHGFLEDLDYLHEQLRYGIQPELPLTKVLVLGADGIELVKTFLQGITKLELVFTANASNNSVIVTPIGPMPAKASVPLTEKTLKATNLKVPRPMNAFLLYRRSYHHNMVKENPGVSNIDISRMLGKQWKDEPEEVKQGWKMKAEEVKRQHAAEHPDYAYKPRKSNEKKRRMTKKKLAQLMEEPQSNEIEQEDLPVGFEPFTFDCFQQAAQPTTSMLQDDFFHVGCDWDGQLAEELTQWNAQQGNGMGVAPVMGIRTTDGQIATKGSNRFSIPVDDTFASDALLVAPPTAAPPAVSEHDAFAELLRQASFEADVFICSPFVDGFYDQVFTV